MKIKTAYKLDYDLAEKIKTICKNRNMSNNELFVIAASCYNYDQQIKTKQNKQQISFCVDESIIKQIEQTAEQKNIKIIDVVTDIFKQFFNKNLL